MSKTATATKPVFNQLVGLMSEPLPNRLVIVTGDKGGVGKSTFARGILHEYLVRNEIPSVFEADKSNPQVKRFYGNSGLTIQETDVTNPNKLDEFIDTLAEQVTNEGEEAIKSGEKILIDLPAQSNQFFFNFIKEMDLFSTLEDRLKIRTTMVVVFSRVKDCVNQLEQLYDVSGKNVDYVIVKNAFYGDEEDFRRYNDSEIRKKIFSEGNCICEIEMPELIEHAFDYIDEKELTFEEAMQPGNKISVEGRTKGWTKNFKKAIEPALPLLGLNNG
ncbi:MAG: chromosome partitioning protein ParA [Cyanobacteria bacterium P01_A01_bin.84]